MKTVPVKYLAGLFLASLIYTALINYFNLSAIKKNNPENILENSRSLVYNSTVYSVDNYWYVNHIKHWMKFGKFSGDTGLPKYEVRRTPVYPLFYGIHYYLFGEEKSYYYIRFTQAFVLALAVVALFLAMYRFTGNMRIAYLSAALYGLFPAVAISTCYTVTESLSSELVCFCMYFLSLCKWHNRKKYWFLAGFFFAMATLCRPTIIFLSLSCAVAIWSFHEIIKDKIKSGLVFAMGALLLFAPWTIRNYKVTGGDIVFLEKFYGDPMDYGMPNIQLRKWIACWDNPADFTSEMVSNQMMANFFRADSVNRDTLIHGFIQQMPPRAFKGNSKQEVHQAFVLMYEFYSEKTHRRDVKIMSEWEQAASESFARLKTDYIKKAPFQYYAITPLIFLKSLTLQSHSTSLAFLDGFESSIFKKMLKGILFLMTAFSWLSVIGLFFWYKKHRAFCWMTFVFIFTSVASSIWFLNYYEARYNFPLFPFLFGALAVVIVEIYTTLRNEYIH